MRQSQIEVERKVNSYSKMPTNKHSMVKIKKKKNQWRLNLLATSMITVSKARKTNVQELF